MCDVRDSDLPTKLPVPPGGWAAVRVQYSFRLNGFRFSEPEPPSVYRLPLEDGTFYMFYTPCASSRFTPFTFYSEFTCKAKCKMVGVFHCKITIPGHP